MSHITKGLVFALFGATILTASPAPHIVRAPRSPLHTSMTSSVHTVLSPSAAPPAVTATNGMRVETDRARMGAAYRALRQQASVAPAWTGSTTDCVAGTASASATRATVESINVVRSMSGLDPVTLDAGYSGYAQRAALLMDANATLSHHPPSSWRCYSPTGATGAARSNLGLNVVGADAVYWYLTEPGSSNTAVGHRRWLINPTTLAVGIGMTNRASAIYVTGAQSSTRTQPQWLPWPTAGYFPAGLEPDGRWSLSSPVADTDFSAATVTVTGPSGLLPVTTYPVVTGYGPDTLVFQISGLPKAQQLTTDVTYRVSVSGITRAGRALAPVSYPVTLMR